MYHFSRRALERSVVVILDAIVEHIYVVDRKALATPAVVLADIMLRQNFVMMIYLEYR